jgi:hypothetical protein
MSLGLFFMLWAWPFCSFEGNLNATAYYNLGNQVSTAMLQHLVESFPRRVEAVITTKGDPLYIKAHDFGMRCLMSRCPHSLVM